MKRYILLWFILLVIPIEVYSQGYNHEWLIGDQSLAYPKARMVFDTSNYVFQNEFRKMKFNDTEGNICDNNGNFLMSSNGVWIANANNDTMMNGSGLNPGPFASSLINSDGLLITDGNVFLPYPSDSTKYILFHQTGDPNNNVPSLELFYSVIDMTLDSGLGAVIQKNDTIFQDTISWGITACRHANGRDWWVIALKDNSDIIYKVLFTPYGIGSITTQHLNVPFSLGNVTQPIFSNDGLKFAMSGYQRINSVTHAKAFLFDFDRCSGVFSGTNVLSVSTGDYLWGLAFSPNSQYLYTNSGEYIFQIDVNSLTIDTVATYDGFSYPIPQATTTFGEMYLAANGKIYNSPMGSAQHIHEMNYPDSTGISCDVQQHAIFLNCWNFRAVPNHPNYYLGAEIGTVCDSLPHVGLQEHFQEVQNFKVSPNPFTNGLLSISYLLPQNKNGVFTIYDTNGKIIYTQPLPEWSTMQQINFGMMNSGLYYCCISSGNSRMTKKLVVIR